MTRDELASRMTWHEFQMWIAIAEMDERNRPHPIGGEPDIIDQLDQLAFRRR